MKPNFQNDSLWRMCVYRFLYLVLVMTVKCIWNDKGWLFSYFLILQDKLGIKVLKGMCV